MPEFFYLAFYGMEMVVSFCFFSELVFFFLLVFFPCSLIICTSFSNKLFYHKKCNEHDNDKLSCNFLQ